MSIGYLVRLMWAIITSVSAAASGSVAAPGSVEPAGSSSALATDWINLDAIVDSATPGPDTPGPDTPGTTPPGPECDLDLVTALSTEYPDVDQFVMMITESFDESVGEVWMASRRDGDWTCDSAPVTARFGRNGSRPLVDRRSGDGTTPAGVFPLGVQTAWDGQTFSLFGNTPAPDEVKAPYREVQPEDCWGATPQDPSYQKLVNRPECPGPDDEWLPGYGEVYSNAAVIGANLNDEIGTTDVSGDEPDEPAYAAAIFLHRHAYLDSGETKATSGCVSLDQAALDNTLRLIDPALNPHFAIGPTDWLTKTG